MVLPEQGNQRQKVGTVREYDDRGKHITTHRELIILPEGGIVIDNPGLREIQMWAEETTLKDTFTDIDAFALNCKFGDCAHTNEPECAIRGAIEEGALDQKRFDSYLKLQKEIRSLVTRKQKVKALNEKIVTEKRIAKLSKQIQKHKNKYEF